MDEPLVTIILATYNGEAFLEEQLLSIINQSYTNIELLVADDCSIDRSYEILTRYALSYKWMHLRQNEERLGLVKNFENLLESAKGDYIAFCDQDDIWREDKVLKAVEILQNEDNSKPLMFHSDLVVTNGKMKIISPSYFKMRSYCFGSDKQLDAIVGRCGVMGNTLVINQKLKSLVLPFPHGLKAHDYWIALINELYGKRLTSFDMLVRYRLHQTNSSNTLDSIERKRGTAPFFSRDRINLPYFTINREKVLKTMLKQHQVEAEEKEVILKFIDYLEFKKNKLYLIYLILRYDFLRDNLLYRMKIGLKILWKRR